MKKIFGIMFCLIAPLLLPTLASAQEETKDVPIFLMNAWSTDKQCNGGNSRSVSFRYLVRHTEEFDGKCVKVTGFYSGRALFIEPDDFQVRYPSSNSRIASRRIGILAKDELHESIYIRPPDGEIIVIGRFTTCEQLASDLGGVFMGSYCHYTGGPIILAASYKR